VIKGKGKKANAALFLTGKGGGLKKTPYILTREGGGRERRHSDESGSACSLSVYQQKRKAGGIRPCFEEGNQGREKLPSKT